MTEKVKITGVPPQYDQSELDRRVESWINVYRQTTQSMELVRSPLPHDLLQQVIDKANDGYKLARSHPVSLAPLNNSVWMVKPIAMQEEDIANIRMEQKEKYIAYLESERARYQEQLRQQLIQAREEKDRKAAEQAKAKQMAEIEAEVQACYTPLVIPD
ncbi:hypothetical protein [Pseudomonas taiwanensis]|uniref:Uncharacterized protein n=1 Tax=Pseudomonas taiwanensis SJ9 TaxID=1388762 RepID=V7DA42_9PSED|nr:hypothetical protein [Pseudomonas taiwanensis]ESW39202.1 hypothetical protein O164_13240 [Pseudomonas taiwanensis SJ9]